MEQSGNIPIFNYPRTLFRNISRNFIGNFFGIYWEYLMGMFNEYSTNMYLLGGNVPAHPELVMIQFDDQVSWRSMSQLMEAI